MNIQKILLLLSLVFFKELASAQEKYEILNKDKFYTPEKLISRQINEIMLDSTIKNQPEVSSMGPDYGIFYFSLDSLGKVKFLGESRGINPWISWAVKYVLSSSTGKWRLNEKPLPIPKDSLPKKFIYFLKYYVGGLKNDSTYQKFSYGVNMFNSANQKLAELKNSYQNDPSNYLIIGSFYCIFCSPVTLPPKKLN